RKGPSRIRRAAAAAAAAAAGAGAGAGPGRAGWSADRLLQGLRRVIVPRGSVGRSRQAIASTGDAGSRRTVTEGGARRGGSSEAAGRAQQEGEGGGRDDRRAQQVGQDGAGAQGAVGDEVTEECSRDAGREHQGAGG